MSQLAAKIIKVGRSCMTVRVLMGQDSIVFWSVLWYSFDLFLCHLLGAVKIKSNFVYSSFTCLESEAIKYKLKTRFKTSLLSTCFSGINDWMIINSPTPLMLLPIPPPKKKKFQMKRDERVQFLGSALPIEGLLKNMFR